MPDCKNLCVFVAGYFITLAVNTGSAEESKSRFRYLRPSGDSYVLESEVWQQKTPDGYAFVSTTHRPKITLTLTLNLDANMRPLGGAITQQVATERQTASVRIADDTAIVTRNDKTEQRLPVQRDTLAVITTAPDWSDILLLLRKSDLKKDGQQKFSGIWFHPTQEARVLTFTVERLGGDTIAMNGKERTVSRFRVGLRSGAYLVWADESGQVIKLMPPQRPENAVVLAGYETATAKLH